MRRLIIIGTALAVLAGGAVALAANGNFDTFHAKYTQSPNKAGSAKHPVPNGSSEVWTAKGNPSGPAAPLTKIVFKVYGDVYNGKHFPKCTAAKINNAGTAKDWNAVCPKGSYIGGGPISANLTGPTGGGGTACNPYLKIYNGGQKTQTFFFTLYPEAPSPKYQCAGGTVHTGTGCAAYTGHLSRSGKTAVLTIPLPGCASTNAGGIGAYAALQKLQVKYLKLTKKVKGKTIGYSESVGCLKGKRPWSFTFTAQNFKGQSPSKETKTIKGKQPC